MRQKFCYSEIFTKIAYGLLWNVFPRLKQNCSVHPIEIGRRTSTSTARPILRTTHRWSAAGSRSAAASRNRPKMSAESQVKLFISSLLLVQTTQKVDQGKSCWLEANAIQITLELKCNRKDLVAFFNPLLR